jgi:hypothetical protein
MQLALLLLLGLRVTLQPTAYSLRFCQQLWLAQMAAFTHRQSWW